MVLDYITVDLTEYKTGKVGKACYIAFDFEPKSKAKMKGIVVQEAVTARTLEAIFRRFAEELEKPQEQEVVN
jgi:hypothetical protein